jgi:hypothetical protein
MCVDCGEPASGWSYDHEDQNELTTPAGHPYSADPTHYAARCTKCHKKFDLAFLRGKSA